MKPAITILDSVHCKANKEARELILPLLKYRKAVWKRNHFGRKESIMQTSFLITGRSGSSGLFLTGLLSRIRKKFKNKIKIINKEETLLPDKRPKLLNIKFRQDQLKALKAIKKSQRGTVIMPTGSGKTIIGLGIMSMFPQHRILFLCHTKDLVEQTAAAIQKHLRIKPYIIGAGYKADWNKINKDKKPIVLSTIQSFAKIQKEKYTSFFDITIIDEDHHVNSLDSQYGKIMVNNLSPCKYGLTATEPTNSQEMLINEGLLGPPIAILTIKEGVRAGIISKPIIKLIPIELKHDINEAAKSYGEYYYYGIVKNRYRNMLIVYEIIKNLKKNETNLIIIERTEHGKILKKLLRKKEIKATFIHGGSSREKRIATKNKLEAGKIKVVICSKVWREGINIPTLNCIINAAGMKEEKLVIQAIGRGLRATETKKTVKVFDFLDPYRYLAEHSIARMQIYIKQGWL